jgi:hypothetical protein
MKNVAISVVFSWVMVNSSICSLFAQEVEHNYQVAPQAADCDSLTFEGQTLEMAIEAVRKAKFRFWQEFKLTRREGFKGGEFYSCDNKTGFLVIRYNTEELFYTDIDKASWEEMTGSGDPEGYYLQKKTDWHLYP